MKRFIALFLALLMCFALCACGKNSSKAGLSADELNTAETEAVQSPEESSAPAVNDTSKLVSDAFSDTLQGDSESYPFAIPCINLQSAEIKALNQAIYDEYYPKYQVAKEQISTQGYTTDCGYIAYKWYVNGDILSLVIDEYCAPDFGGGDVYKVYNISISGMSELGKDAVLKAAGISAGDFSGMVKETLQKTFESFYGNGGSGIEAQFASEQLARTLSDENISACSPYLNEHGELCITARIYSMAGADYYFNNINLVSGNMISYN